MRQNLPPTRSLPLLVALFAAGTLSAQTVFINEIHYDDSGADSGEGVEVAGPAGTDLTGWTIVPYNGSGGANYTPIGTLSGTIPDLGGGYGVVWAAITGLQNGSPDGVALVDAGSTVVQFLSYEGSFTATAGPANGQTSTDIGVTESGSVEGQSLQLTGTGTVYGDFTWATQATATPGAFNNGQTFAAGSCGISIGTVTTSCNSNNPGPGDTYDLSIAYSGVQAGITVVNNSGSGTVGGDDPASIPNGTIVVSGISDADAYAVTFTNPCDALNVSGAAPSCEPPLDYTVLVINEVDYDQDGTDALEFIELKNTGAVALDLAGVEVRLINGSGGAPYAFFTLPSFSLAAGDYFVICGTGSAVANCDHQVSPGTNLIQNGAPDGVALYDPADVLIDAVTYEGDIAGYTEGSGVGLEDNPNLIPSYEHKGISRFPDGVDTDQNNVDFSLRCSTPGVTNTANAQFCLCEPPTVNVTPTCVDDFTWDILVDVTDLGSSATVNIMNDLNFDSETGVGIGQYNIGTFNNLDVVAITVTHDTYSECDVTIGSITEDCTPPPPCVENEMELTIHTDTYPGEITWVLQQAGGGSVICSGGPYFQSLSTITEACCLADGCYELVLFDGFGDGIDAPGGYVLADAQGNRVLDSDGSYNASGTADNPFCVPLGTDRPIFQQCDKEDWLPNDVIVATENASVSAEWTVGDQTDDGYQFWFFDPDGGYSRRIFRSHAASGGFGPANATRACHLKLSSIVTLPLPTNRLLNVRIRSRVNGVDSEFGPACRFRIPSPPVACPSTKLIDNPNNPNFSCGVTRAFGGSDKVHCYPVAGATHYRFRFENVGESFVRQITITSTNLLLNWVTLPLQDGITYTVTVQASLDNAVTFCPAGDVCDVTIGAGQEFRSFEAVPAAAPSFSVYPNPTDGSGIRVRLGNLDASVQSALLELIDAQGRLSMSRQLPVQDGQAEQTLALDQELPAGLYLVRLTAGDRVMTERLVVRR